MTKTESAQKTLQSLIIDTAEQLLACSGGAGARAAIPGTDKLILIGTPDWIAENVPSVDALIGTTGGDKLRGHLDRRAEVAEQAVIDTPEFMDALCSFYEQASCEDFDKVAYDAARAAVLARLATPAPVTAAQAEVDKLRAQVEQLQAMLEDRVSRKPNDEQEWAKVDGAIAFHLIERHADNWHDAGNMMESWARARLAAPAAAQAVRVPEVPDNIVYGIAAYGNERADDDPKSAATFGKVITDIRALLAAAPAAPTAKEAGQVRDAALEDAAKACEDVAIHWHQFDDTYAAGKKSGALGCATTIRALKRPAGDTKGEQA
jgi:hypothetical protein